jgi:hypothetical protein
MRRLGAFALLALCACAHAPDQERAARKRPAPLELADNQTAPVRQGCKLNGPQLPAGESIDGTIQVSYLIGADGSVSDVTARGRASAGALKAIRAYISSCTYAPATRAGKPVAIRWRGELDFTAAREHR